MLKMKLLRVKLLSMITAGLILITPMLGQARPGKVQDQLAVSLTIVNSCNVQTNGSKVQSTCTGSTPLPQIVESPETTESTTLSSAGSGAGAVGGLQGGATGTISFQGAILAPTLAQPTASATDQSQGKVVKLHRIQTIDGQKYRVLEVIYPR